MAKAAKRISEEQAETASDLVVMATANPLAIFTDREQFSAFYQRMKEEIEREGAHDVTTKAGRDAIRSLARRVVKTKTTLEKAGKDLVEEWRQKTSTVTTARISMVNELDALAKEVRKPLTEWEEAEQARVDACRATIQRFKDMAAVSLEDTAATVRARGKELWEIPVGEEFAELADEATEAKAAAIATLQRALERLTKEEAGRAELEQLRAAQAERDARDALKLRADGLIAHCRECAGGTIGGQPQAYGLLLYELETKIPPLMAELGEFEAEVEAVRIEALGTVRTAQERDAAERLEAAREAEAQRVREAEERAAENARQEAVSAAREAELERQRQHEAQLAEERRQREETERVAREEREERERQDRERAEAERIAAEEQAARDADKAHRAKVRAAAVDAIAKLGPSKAIADKIVLAIIAGEVPAISLRF